MINAKEAKEMVERVINNEIVRFKENAMRFCEELSKEIEENANKKYCGMVVTIPHNVKRNYVVEILKDNGYSVTIREDGRLDIMW